MKKGQLRNLIRETIKEISEDDAMKKSALGMAMYGKKSKMNEEEGEVNVFGYQTQHFDICPGAQSLYKAIVDGEHGKQDKDLVIRVAKARSLSKKQRAATARKKVAGSKRGKQFVKNTPKAKVSFKKKK